MVNALWVDPLGRRTEIVRTVDGGYLYDGAPLPNGHYAFDKRKWRHVVHGPYSTPADAAKIVRNFSN